MPPQQTRRTARSIAREEITATIVASARTQLAEVGPAQLSLRAVTRDVGMVSSAVYRYFPSRDDLLTALITEAYDELGEAVESATQAAHRASIGKRWVVLCQAVRTWALAHQHDYALLFGSPVPGYVAPQSTIGPATRVPRILTSLLIEAHRAGRTVSVAPVPVPRKLHRALSGFRTFAGEPVPDDLALAGLRAWATLYGTISFELFGHLVGSVDDYDAYFDHVARQLGVDLGLA